MEPDDGWVNPDAPAKRQKLSDSKNGSPSESSSSSSRSAGISAVSVPVSSFSASPSVRTVRRREDCRYGVNCYRRNESHLLQYRHQLLEDAYGLMKASNDFTKFPASLPEGGADIPVILEQAGILRSAGFQGQEEDQRAVSVDQSRTRRNEDCEGASGGCGTNRTVTTSGSQERNEPRQASSQENEMWKDDPLGQLFEERRRKYRQDTKKKIQEALGKSLSSEGSNGITSKASSSSGARQKLKSMADRWKDSCPFNFFLTKVRDISVEKDGVLSASFTDMFDPSLGDIKAICHINFMVEAGWFFEQTLEAGLDGKPTRIIYGDDSEELKQGAKPFPWLKLFYVRSPFPFGHHHTKMSFVQYTDESIRFMIYTANLVESDWDNRTQGIWISPKCSKVPEGSSALFGESPTNFRADMLQYLSTYSVQATAAWRDVIKKVDCSEIRVFFVASAPITSQSALNGFQFGTKKMEKILRSYEMDTAPDWQLIIQCSSIGTLGASADDWVIGEFAAAMSGKDRCIKGPISLVYPSHQNVKDSFDGVLGGGCLPYSAITHRKQRWLERHLCQWKADCSGRTRAPPHIKSYSRLSPDQTKLAWVLLTSANLSKAAWGKLNKNRDRLSVMSWEAGVLFIPELLCSSKYFTFPNTNSSSSSPSFPLYYDIPLVKYEKQDTPWFFEYLQVALSDQD